MPNFKDFAGNDVFVSDEAAAAWLASNPGDGYRLGEAFSTHGRGPDLHSDGSTGLSPAPVPRAQQLANDAVVFLRTNPGDAHRLDEALGISPAEASTVLARLGVSPTTQATAVTADDVMNAGVRESRVIDHGVIDYGDRDGRVLTAGPIGSVAPGGGLSFVQMVGIGLMGWSLWKLVKS